MTSAYSVSMDSEIRTHVLRSLALNRAAGYHFTGNFLNLSHDCVSAENARTSMHVGPHCAEENGNLNYGAVAVFADLSVAANVRAGHDLATRLATVSMNMNFTGAPITGRIKASTCLQGYLVNSAGRQGAGEFTLSANGQRICFGNATFMVLAPPEGMTLYARQLRREQDAEVAPLLENDLVGDEHTILRCAADAIAARETGAFIHGFWNISTQQLPNGAAGELKNGPQVSNRVGHVQGGITMGLGIATAEVALSAKWMLSAVSAWFISPCEGQFIKTRSKIIHQGRLTSVVRTQITGQGRRRVMEMVTTHAHRLA